MSNETSLTPSASRGFDRPLALFAAVLIVVALLRLLIGFLAIPLPYVTATSVVVSVIFVAAPVLGLFSAARSTWSFARAFVLFLAAGIVWIVGQWAAMRTHNPLGGGLLVTLSQSGLIAWCFSLGALLALLLKDRNVLLPIAIFLALFDMWLVFAPEGLVNKSVVIGPARRLRKMAYQVPEVKSSSAGGRAAALLYIGPADYVFLSMFFVALYRFKMRTKRTFKVMVPVLGLYLLIALFCGNVSIGPISLAALPALVPIGIVVLVVNRDLFKLNRDERLTTWVIAIGGTAFVMWRIVQPVPPPQLVPLTMPDDPSDSVPQGSTGPSAQGLVPAIYRIVPRNRPDPR